MNREQAINYLICRGITEYQVSEIVRALTYKPRDCANCKHYIVKDTRANWGSQETTKIYGCERWECEYEPTTKNNLGVEEVTALAEWTEKLTKASEDAYNKGYADGMKALEQEPQKFKWCTDCKEYDQEKHCCHRWSKVIRNTVEEMKQEYIEREVLDKIRAEIKSLERFEIRGEVTPLVNVDRVLEIIDKAESEAEDDSN